MIELKKGKAIFFSFFLYFIFPPSNFELLHLWTILTYRGVSPHFGNLTNRILPCTISWSHQNNSMKPRERHKISWVTWLALSLTTNLLPPGNISLRRLLSVNNGWLFRMKQEWMKNWEYVYVRSTGLQLQTQFNFQRKSVT